MQSHTFFLKPYSNALDKNTELIAILTQYFKEKINLGRIKLFDKDFNIDELNRISPNSILKT